MAASSRRGVKAFTRGRVSSGKWHGEAIRTGNWVANRGEEVARGSRGQPCPLVPCQGVPLLRRSEEASSCTTRLRTRAQRCPKQGKGGGQPKGHPTSSVGRIPKHNFTPNLSAPPPGGHPGDPAAFVLQGQGAHSTKAEGPQPRSPVWDETGRPRAAPRFVRLRLCGCSGLPGPRRGACHLCPRGVLFPVQCR